MRVAVISSLLLGLMSLWSSQATARCKTFSQSTMYDAGISPIAAWRTDYPSSSSAGAPAWSTISFASEPARYMEAVLETVRPYFRYKDASLAGTGSEPWWMSEWMDYDKFGREPLMGLTKELAPRTHQLSQTSQSGSQVWAVNFYNEPGAVALHQVFADPCSPVVPEKLLFPEGTVAIKFLFTDANLGRFTSQVDYLNGGPVYRAHIDLEGVGFPADTSARKTREVNMLQLDIGVRDSNATKTGWVFGTFVWMGPLKGDGLFDNLVPAVLLWGNDEGVVSDDIKESWVNPAIKTKLSGWNERPFLGFQGRANGPADNLNSSCLSCHAAARLPLAPAGIARPGRDPVDLDDAAAVAAHVDLWFKNIKPGEVFQPANPLAVAALDYSLQVRAAIERMCQACEDGALDGDTPDICAKAGYFTGPRCVPQSTDKVMASQGMRQIQALPRE
ncbi:hypothetical protein [Mesorhizobium sp.]|uniref:hypothetical protein n=1 Tax=Mesorhizobium sp. TaxID=1871066 RepID=UPI00121A7B5B|nr:hypothetical protein [Mesorhizobium sp.]TIS45803.1 MAG: hypothetical protein E5W96_29390 [Mesorhizobium sp.]